MLCLFCLFELAWHAVAPDPLKLLKLSAHVYMAHFDNDIAVLQGTIEIIPPAVPFIVLELDIDVIVKVGHH